MTKSLHRHAPPDMGATTTDNPPEITGTTVYPFGVDPVPEGPEMVTMAPTAWAVNFMGLVFAELTANAFIFAARSVAVWESVPLKGVAPDVTTRPFTATLDTCPATPEIVMVPVAAVSVKSSSAVRQSNS